MLAPSPSPPSLFKRVVDALRPPRAQPFREMGVSGTAHFGGYIQTRERSPQWAGQQRYVTIADMAVNASIVAAGVHYFLNLIAHPRWTVEPADESPEAAAAAELVDEIFHDLNQPWSRVVRRAGTYRFYGFGVQEWTAKRRPDGRVGLASIEPRPQQTIARWALADDGAVEGAWQASPQTGEELGIPRSKILYLVDDVLTDSPEGVGIFRHLAEPWERLRTYYALEARGFERDLRGTPVGRIPYTQLREAVRSGDLTEAQAAAMIKAMEDFVKLQVKQSDTAITLDSQPYFSQAADGAKVAGVQQWGLELLQGDAAGMAEIAAAISRTQTEMARVLTCEHLMMGESSGNRSLAEDKSRNLYLVANAVLEDIAAGVQHDVVPRICDLNGVPEAARPRCRVEDVAFKDAEAVAATLQKMALAGAVLAPDDPVIEDVRTLLGVSPPSPVPAEMVGQTAGGEAAPEEGTDEEDLAADVAKANPYHDERGRFDEGPGAVGGVDLDHGYSSVQDARDAVVTLAGSYGLKLASEEGSSLSEARYLTFKPQDESLVISRGNWNNRWGNPPGTLLNPGFSIRISVHRGYGGKTNPQFNLRLDQPHDLRGLDLRLRTIILRRPRGLRGAGVLEKGGSSDQPRTLYIKRRLLNAGALRDWAASQGIASTLPASDMHVTVAFSRDLVDWSAVEPDEDSMTVDGGLRDVHQFPFVTKVFDSNQPRDERGRWGEGGGSWSKSEIVSQIGPEIKQIMRQDNSGEDFGLRILPEDTFASVGGTLEPSYRWEDGEFTSEKLGGTSAIGIKASDKIERALKDVLAGKEYGGGYVGTRLALISGELRGSGEDVGEVLLREARVRRIFMIPAKVTKVASNGPLVLRFESPELHRRWRALREAGASWDFSEYQPHVTVTYSVAEADVSGVEPYRGPLIFGPEEWAEVDDGWAGAVREEPTRAVRGSVPRRALRRTR